MSTRLQLKRLHANRHHLPTPIRTSTSISTELVNYTPTDAVNSTSIQSVTSTQPVNCAGYSSETVYCTQTVDSTPLESVKSIPIEKCQVFSISDC